MKHSKAFDRIFVAVSLSALVAASLRADDLYIWAQETLAGVTFFYSGSVDTTGFPAPVSDKGGKGSGRIDPDSGAILFGSTYGRYDNVLPSSGRSFGSGTGQSANSRTGDNLWLSGVPSTDLGLPSGYVSGTPISGTLEFSGATFLSLGVNPTPFSFNTTAGSNTIHLFLSPAEAAARAAQTAKLKRKIRKTKKMIRKAKKKAEVDTAKKLRKKLKKLRRKLRAL